MITDTDQRQIFESLANSILTCGISHVLQPPRNALSGNNQDHKPILNGQISTQNSNSAYQPNTLSSTTMETTSHASLLSRLTRFKELLPFLGVFAPLVVFWAIFYQQNSTWILQGAQMNCQLSKLQIPPGNKYVASPQLPDTPTYIFSNAIRVVSWVSVAKVCIILQLYIRVHACSCWYTN